MRERTPPLPLPARDLEIREDFRVMSDAEFGAYMRDLFCIWKTGTMPRSYTGLPGELAAQAYERRERMRENGTWFHQHGDPDPRDVRRRQRMSRAGWVSPATRRFVYARDGYHCLHCGTDADLSVDHIIPICRGGTSHLTNLQTLCRSCNARKGAKIA